MLDLKKIVKEAFITDEMVATAKISGLTFVFGPTSHKDEFIIVDMLSKASMGDTMLVLSNVRIRTIASMLTSINGEVIPEIVVTGEGDSRKSTAKVLYLMDHISEWPASLITTLYLVCTDLKRNIKKQVRTSLKYDWFGEDLIAKEDLEEEKEMLDLKAEEALAAARLRELEDVALEEADLAESGEDDVSTEDESPLTKEG